MEKVERPWGWYQVVNEGDRYKTKNIEVNPEQSLSLQYHYHRSEHWVVVGGTAKVQVDDVDVAEGLDCQPRPPTARR